MAFEEILNSLVKSKHLSVGFGNFFMSHYLQQLESRCCLIYPGYFVLFKVVMELLIFGKLLEILLLMLEVHSSVKGYK